MLGTPSAIDARYLLIDGTRPMIGGLTVADVPDGINSGDYPIQFESGITDSVSAVGFYLDTLNTLSSDGSKLLSLNNGAVEKLYVDKDGELFLASIDQGTAQTDYALDISGIPTTFSRLGGIKVGLSDPGAAVSEIIGLDMTITAMGGSWNQGVNGCKVTLNGLTNAAVGYSCFVSNSFSTSFSGRNTFTGGDIFSGTASNPTYGAGPFGGAAVYRGRLSGSTNVDGFFAHFTNTNLGRMFAINAVGDVMFDGRIFNPDLGAGGHQNLILDTEDLSTANWTLTGGTTLTANAADAPDGSPTADQINFPVTANASIEQDLGFASANETITAYCWAKASTGTYLRIKSTNESSEVQLTGQGFVWQLFTITHAFTGASSGNVIIDVYNSLTGNKIQQCWGFCASRSAVPLAYSATSDHTNYPNQVEYGAAVNGHLSIVSSKKPSEFSIVESRSQGVADLLQIKNMIGGNEWIVDSSFDLNISGGNNIAMSTTTGTMIATAVNQLLGFWGAAPVTQPTVTGSRGGNVALASLLTQLSTMGLVVDSTTA